MNKIPLFLFCIVFFNANFIFGQRKCGIQDLKNELIAKYPGFESQFNAYQETIKKNATAFAPNAKNARATEDITVPVVFHIVVNQAQYEALGGRWGIEQRCRKQIEVLNQDFNKQNSDSTLIPTNWKPRYANVGIHFGLAHTDPYGYPNPGFTIKIISGLGFNSFHNAKTTDSGGVDAWDVTKYINVWCVNFTDPSYSGLLGITVPNSMLIGTKIPNTDMGICITYNSLGKRQDTTENYPKNGVSGNYYDLGRTLTHEMGHYFEIWHVWGDDGGLCPWTGGVSVLNDIPPQGNNTFDNPGYNIPGGTLHDNCHLDSSGHEMQPIGIACLDYLDYTDDIGMHLFTPDQAAVMVSQVNSPTGESYSLTQHPTLLEYPDGAPQTINIFPNPTNGPVSLIYENTTNKLTNIMVYNMVGSKLQVYEITPSQNIGAVNLDLTKFGQGVYILKCIFKSATITQKITVQTLK